MDIRTRTDTHTDTHMHRHTDTDTDTHTHTHTHTQTCIPTISTESILRNQAQAGIQPTCAWFKNMSVIVIIQINVLCNANLLKLIIRFEVWFSHNDIVQLWLQNINFLLLTIAFKAQTLEGIFLLFITTTHNDIGFQINFA